MPESIRNGLVVKRPAPASCRFAHPYQSSTAAVTWGGSNGPVYRSESFRRVLSLYVETVALCCVFTELSKPSVSLPINVTSLIANNSGRVITQPGLKLASHVHTVLRSWGGATRDS